MIVSKTDASSLGYVVEALYATMWRKNAADPYGVSELKKVVSEILWVRTYVLGCLCHYPEHFLTVSKGEAARVAKRFLDSPLQFFMKTESPERDPTWLQSLPNEALRCFMKHALELSQGLYQPEIRGRFRSLRHIASYCSVLLCAAARC